MPKEYSQFICLSVILIDSVFKISKNYYLQAFIEESKYLLKKNKIPKYIIDEISSNSDREDSDEEISNVENSDEKNSDQEISDEEN